MLLARKIIQTEFPENAAYFEPHDSYYIGSDVFYTYIVSNNCWETRIRQRTEEGYFTKAESLKTALLHGQFPPDIREKFRSVLEYFGQSPIIVRSSSFLEDGFGNALRENMSPYSVSIREARRNGWTRLSRLYARCMPAPWIFLLWSIGNRGGCSTAMNRWRFLCRECRDPITGSCSFQRQQEWDTATAPTAGINI